MSSDTEKNQGGYRLVSEHGTHFATVATIEQATADREFYADRYGCIVLIQRTANKPQTW